MLPCLPKSSFSAFLPNQDIPKSIDWENADAFFSAIPNEERRVGGGRYADVRPLSLRLAPSTPAAITRDRIL